MNLAYVGIALAIIGNLWIVVLAFRSGLLWGLGSLFVPFVGLVYCVLNLGETWKPLLLTVVGLALLASHSGAGGT